MEEKYVWAIAKDELPRSLESMLGGDLVSARYTCSNINKTSLFIKMWNVQWGCVTAAGVQGTLNRNRSLSEAKPALFVFPFFIQIEGKERLRLRSYTHLWLQ